MKKIRHFNLFKLALTRQLRYKTRKIRHLLVKLLSPTIYKRTHTPQPSYTRGMIDFLRVHANNKSLVGVEIGVFYGSNALNILEKLNIKQLFLIDPYIPYVNVLGEVSDTRRALSTCKDKMSKFNDKVELIVKKSVDAVNDVPNNLDFAYIDGNHNYEFVKKDVELYYPKVKRGGVLGGHDFTLRKEHKGVFDAVIELAVDNRLTVFAEKGDWWIVKPKGVVTIAK